MHYEFGALRNILKNDDKEVRKFIVKEEINDYGFVRTGLELYYIEKKLSKVDKT